MTYRSSKSVHLCGLGASRRIKQKIFLKVYLRNHNIVFFTCSLRPPTLLQCHMDLHVWAYPRPGYIFQVSSKSVHGFRSPRGSNLVFPIILAIRFYNSLYCRTSRDSASIVIASDKSSISTNCKSTTRFPTSHRRSMYVTPKSPKGGSKREFVHFLRCLSHHCCR